MATRADWIRSIYMGDLGRNDFTDAEVNYWDSQSQLATENDLRRTMRYSAGLGADNPNVSLFQDPAYSTFVRQMTAREAQIESDRIARQEALRRQGEIAMSGYNTQQGQGLRSAANEYASRGMFRSGGRLRREGEIISEMDRQRNATQLKLAEDSANYGRDASREISDLRRERSEQELATRQRLTQRDMGAM